MAASAILMLTSSDRTRGHGLLRAIDTGRLPFHVLAASGAECSAPGGAGPHAVRHHGAGGCRGTGRGRVGLDQGGARPDRPLGGPASTPRPAPTGGGFSGTGPAVRRFFYMDGESIALAVPWELARAGKIPRPRLPRRPPGTSWTSRSARRSAEPWQTFAESALGRADSADVRLQIRSG